MWGFDKNASFLLAIYGLGFACIIISSLTVWFRAKRAKSALDRLEQQDPS